MCDFGISESIMIGLSVASAAASAAAAQQQAAAQQKYQNDMYQQAAQSARDNFVQQSGVAGARMSQNAQGAGAAEFQTQANLAQAVGHAQASAAEAGVGGNSVSALFNDFSNIAAQNNDATQTNLRFQNEQLVQDMRSLRSQNQSRINQATPGPVQFPSWLGVGLGTASSLYNQYDAHQQRMQYGMYSPNSYSGYSGMLIPNNQAPSLNRGNISSG